MNSKASPYLPYPDDPVVARDLALIKDAAEHFECSADTLKNNAKTRRFPAYQAAHGMPVFVSLQDVADFLKSRRDIDSVFRKAGSSKSAASKRSPQVPVGTGKPSSSSVPKQEAVVAIPVTSLVNATPEQLSLVAGCLEEVAAYLRQAIAATASNHQPDAEVQPAPPSPVE